jgi:hypothetical protein
MGGVSVRTVRKPPPRVNDKWTSFVVIAVGEIMLGAVVLRFDHHPESAIASAKPPPAPAPSPGTGRIDDQMEAVLVGMAASLVLTPTAARLFRVDSDGPIPGRPSG